MNYDEQFTVRLVYGAPDQVIIGVVIYGAEYIFDADEGWILESDCDGNASVFLNESDALGSLQSLISDTKLRGPGKRYCEMTYRDIIDEHARLEISADAYAGAIETMTSSHDDWGEVEEIRRKQSLLRSEAVARGYRAEAYERDVQNEVQNRRSESEKEEEGK
jgi:hypothetical protein